MGLYERVIINRKEGTTVVDRIDANWWIAEPFLGQRDLFYTETRENCAPKTAFVRHNFWMWKPDAMLNQLTTHFTSLSYSSAFNRTKVA